MATQREILRVPISCDGKLIVHLSDSLTNTTFVISSQGQNPFESDDFTKNGSHLIDSSFNFDSSPRHGEYFGDRATVTSEFCQCDW